MDRNLALEFVRVTEAAAITSAKWIGRGDKKAADQAAVNEMRSRFNQIDFYGKVVIGEGTKDKAPMLYEGEIVGKNNQPKMDLAIDPLECTDSVAYGRYNAMSVIAAGAENSLFNAPDTYMDKLAVGKKAAHAIDLNLSLKSNIQKVARTLKKKVSDITVIILDRERHKNIINETRAVGARVRLITDGDVSAAIATCLPESGIDILAGIGGSTEAVLAAVPIKILGGEILCRFKPRNNSDKNDIYKHGIKNLNKIYSAHDLAKGRQLTFTATGIIDGPLLKGVVFEKDRIITHSIVVRGQSGTIRYMTTYHHGLL